MGGIETKHIFGELSSQYQEVINRLKEALVKDVALIAKVCNLLKGKDHTVDKEIGDLSDEEKVDACLSYLSIALVSGEVHINSIEDLLKDLDT